MAAGTIASLSIEGIAFDVTSDADFGEVFSEFTNTMVATSGEGSLSQEKRIRQVDGVVLALQPGDKSILAEFADSGRKDLSMVYVNRNGDVYSGLGSFNIESNKTMKNQANITLLPVGKWTESLNG